MLARDREIRDKIRKLPDKPGTNPRGSGETDKPAEWSVSDQVIRGKPGAACQRCRGTETSAEDLVGPPERMVSERRSTAVVLGSR